MPSGRKKAASVGGWALQSGYEPHGRDDEGRGDGQGRRGAPPESAIAHVAALIADLDVCSDSYERDMERLVKIGATIWDLHSGPGGAYDPTWILTFLRP
jgi:hypothetical protein